MPLLAQCIFADVLHTLSVRTVLYVSPFCPHANLRSSPPHTLLLPSLYHARTARKNSGSVQQGTTSSPHLTHALPSRPNKSPCGHNRTKRAPGVCMSTCQARLYKQTQLWYSRLLPSPWLISLSGFGATTVFHHRNDVLRPPHSSHPSPFPPCHQHGHRSLGLTAYEHELQFPGERPHKYYMQYQGTVVFMPGSQMSAESQLCFHTPDACRTRQKGPTNHAKMVWFSRQNSSSIVKQCTRRFYPVTILFPGFLRYWLGVATVVDRAS